jgi:hypothetical protein
MIRLQESKALKRKIRQDDVADLAVPTWTLVREAIQGGRTGEALELLEYACAETRVRGDSRTASHEVAITKVASFGEEELEKVWRQSFERMVLGFLETRPSVEESLQRLAETHRGYFSNITITEEKDKYVMRLDPCGTGGRLRRSKTLATTTKAHPWSWGKSGVCLYCTHCCLMWEIIPIEVRGYPVKITTYSDRPEDPCIHLFYKRPELIPEEYFRMIGKPPWKKEQ